MITYELQREGGILVVTPEGPLEATDFENMAKEVDSYIEEEGGLKGLMIYAESFPGWEDFGALVSHLQFVKGHHAQMKKVAAVSDSKVLALVPRLVGHFVTAEIRHFDYADRQAALEWLRS